MLIGILKWEVWWNKLSCTEISTFSGLTERLRVGHDEMEITLHFLNMLSIITYSYEWKWWELVLQLRLFQNEKSLVLSMKVQVFFFKKLIMWCIIRVSMCMKLHCSWWGKTNYRLLPSYWLPQYFSKHHLKLGAANKIKEWPIPNFY